MVTADLPEDRPAVVDDDDDSFEAFRRWVFTPHPDDTHSPSYVLLRAFARALVAKWKRRLSRGLK